MKSHSRVLLLAVILSPATYLFAAKDVPVPKTCTPQVNQGLGNLIASKTTKDVDNIMVCGVATAASRLQPGKAHGNHHVTTLAVVLPDGAKVNVQVVTNDTLDGIVLIPAQALVYAYGQGYLTSGPWVAGVHDVHCSTHPTADNGWVSFNGKKIPSTCPAPSH